MSLLMLLFTQYKTTCLSLISTRCLVVALPAKIFAFNSHTRQNSYCCNLKQNFEDLPPCHCCTININSRTTGTKLLWRSVTIWINLLEFVKVLFLKVMQLCKPICAARTLRRCFERYELVRTTAKALWHEDIALDQWSVTWNFPASHTCIAALQNLKNTCCVNHALFQ